MVLCIGHRGAAGLALENTLDAIDLALALGVDIVEIDIRATRDGQIVVLHDAGLDRTGHGNGLLHTLTYQQIKSQHSTLRPGQGVPLLSEVLQRIADAPARQTADSPVRPAAAPPVRLMIEIKSPGLYPNLVTDLCSQIRSANYTDKVIFFSFNRKVLAALHNVLPSVAIGIASLIPLRPSRLHGIDYLALHWMIFLLFPGYIRVCQKRQCKVFAWTVNHKRVMKYLIGKNIDGIITDRPDILKGLIT